MMGGMKTWKMTLISKRLAVFSALVFVAATHGCSCDDEQDLDGGDVAIDAADIVEEGDAAVDTGPALDAAQDAASDADASPDAAMDTAADAPSDTGSHGDAASDAAQDSGGDAVADTDAHDAPDTGLDTNTSDTRPADIGTDSDPDTGPDAFADTGDASSDADTAAAAGDCISGATGTHAVRFSWQGNGPNSTAWVDYETNELPDTSRWHVGAYSQSFSYSPVYTDTFLAEGGLELSGTVFIDVELSTDGLGPLNKVTIAVYGRSFNTTSPGSFSWQTFSGSGATPSGFVHNSAPYEWYRAEATAALPAGDDGILLRLEAGPPSNSLVVHSVEICFDEN